MSNASTQLNPDAPISKTDEDKFAFSPFAEGLAGVVADYDRSSSFTIGICGPWGSGKTSLINLTRDALKEKLRNGDHNVHAVVLPYSPWLIGNRDALLRGLLPAVANGIRRSVPRKKRTSDLNRAIKTLDLYGRAIKGVEMGLTVGAATATAFGLAVAPWLAPVVAAFSGLGKILGLVSDKPATLDELRDAAQRALRKAKVRVLIVIDDLDRLDPTEVVEMARLVRSTLDLPHVTFLVAYDRQQVANSVRTVLGVDGDAYLEKIVQLQVNVPACNSYDLARALAEELQSVFGDLSEEETNSVRSAIWAGARQLFLDTPRDIARITNSLSFGWSMLQGSVDAGDLLLVTCLRLKTPELYEWCRRYCEEYFVNRPQRMWGDGPTGLFSQHLTQACETAGVEQDTLLSVLENLLPGISMVPTPDDTPSLFGDQEDADAAVRNRRLSSPEHWRKYFDLVEGRYGITDQGFATFIEDAKNNPQVAVSTFLEHSQRTDPSGTNSGERLLDRLRAEARGASLDTEQRIGLISVLANSADELDRNLGPASFFGATAYQMASWTLRPLLWPLSPEHRELALRNAASDGTSIGWISYVLRGELFDHGIIGRGQREREPMLDENALRTVNGILVERIQDTADHGSLLELHSLPNCLLFWRDASENPELVRARVSHSVSTDAGLVLFLHALKQMVRSSAGDYWKIDRDLVAEFYDVEMAIERLRQIQSEENGELSSKATDALEMLRRDRD
ncbi:P-loop NTPase fold protein [Ruegeria sp. HKCCA0370]|uniref:KAP family P-loop NTPase fold protein n=1 Tax=Ruegeria sp. HKCCA0370 TaxID=2682995 RepID=UPI0014877E26